ncbi:hypothetical protein QZH41_013025, partial [Actinostola sp. cb2023]
MTEAGGFPSGSKARTDVRISVLSEANWFRFPYPGQWGTPTVSLAGVLGMLAGVIASIIESLGDYYSCARMSGAPPPPVHAINRGVATEGFGCLLAGAWGSGNGTTSYSQNIGAIGITKVGSRLVIQTAALLMLVLGMFGKFGALFTTIPDPIVGGVLMVMFGMIVAIGISNLQFIDLNSSRNHFVLGFSLILGMAVPFWVNANGDAIKTGIREIDQIFKVLLTTNMFVAGFVGCIFDNTVPGTLDERGMITWREQIHNDHAGDADNTVRNVYNLPFCLKGICEYKFAKFVPFLPYHPPRLADTGIDNAAVELNARSDHMETTLAIAAEHILDVDPSLSDRSDHMETTLAIAAEHILDVDPSLSDRSDMMEMKPALVRAEHDSSGG